MYLVLLFLQLPILFSLVDINELCSTFPIATAFIFYELAMSFMTQVYACKLCLHFSNAYTAILKCDEL